MGEKFMSERPLFRVEHLQKYFPLKKKSIFQRETEYVRANKDLSLEIFEGETLGIVGESGCGKSTFGRTLIQLYEQTGGVSLYYGNSIEELMPQYVGEVYRSIPKVFKNYDKDLKALNALEKNFMSADDAADPNVEAHRLAKIEFEKKYGNILRLAGGLLVSSDLSKVQSLLTEKYEKGAAVATLLKKIEFEEHRLTLRNQDPSNSKKIAELKSNLAIKEAEKEKIDAEVDAFKSTLTSHPRFDEFESQLDDGIDLGSLNKNEMRL